MSLLERCQNLPVRELSPGDVLMREDEPIGEMFVLAEGELEVSRAGQLISSIAESGAAFGEVSVLLDSAPSATVTATGPTRVHVIDDPVGFMTADPDSLFEIARTLARRLARLSDYLADVKSQYADAGGHLELMDEVLSELAFGQSGVVEPGSERDPDPLY